MTTNEVLVSRKSGMVTSNNWTDKEFMTAYMKEYGKNYYANRKEFLKKKVSCKTCNKEVNLSSFQKHLQSSSHAFHCLNLEEREKFKINKILQKSISKPIP